MNFCHNSTTCTCDIDQTYFQTHCPVNSMRCLFLNAIQMLKQKKTLVLQASRSNRLEYTLPSQTFQPTFPYTSNNMQTPLRKTDPPLISLLPYKTPSIPQPLPFRFSPPHHLITHESIPFAPRSISVKPTRMSERTRRRPRQVVASHHLPRCIRYAPPSSLRNGWGFTGREVELVSWMMGGVGGVGGW